MTTLKPIPFGSPPIAKPTGAIPFGSKPVSTTTFPKAEPPAVKQSFMQKIGSSLIDPLKGGIKNIQSAGNQIKEAFSGGVNQVKEGVSQVGNTTGNPLDLIEGVGKAGSGVVSAAFSPLAPILNPTLGAATKLAADKISNNKTVQKFSNSKIGQGVAKGAEDIANYSNIAGAVGGAMESLPTIKKIPGAITDIADRIVGKKAIANDISKATAEKAIQAPKVAGKIVQGGISDIPKAQKALSQIDISKVKTYRDLGVALSSKIKEIAGLQDKAYETRPENIHINDLTSQGHNFVNDALQQLRDHFEKTNDIEGQAQIKELQSKAGTQGLTVKEVNNLARLHGRTINAFNANGEAAAGLTKQAAENTRQGLKSTVRNYMGDEAMQGSDMQMHNLETTKALVETVAEKANALGQKIIEQPWYKKVGSKGAALFDKISGGNVKSFVNYFIPRGEGLKTLNALDLEKSLQKNLSSLQKLTDGKFTEDDFITKLNDLINKGNPQKLLPEPKVGAPKSSNNIPIEQPSRIITNEAVTPKQNTIIKNGAVAKRSTGAYKLKVNK